MSTSQPMTLYEVLDLLAQNYDKIDFLWNFFVGVHLAVLGGLIVMTNKVQLFEKLLAAIGYCAFNWVNYNALVDSYGYHLVLLDEVHRIGLSQHDVGRLVIDYLNDFNLRARIGFLHFSHLAAGAVVVTAIAFANRFVASSRSAQPKPGEQNSA